MLNRTNQIEVFSLADTNRISPPKLCVSITVFLWSVQTFQQKRQKLSKLLIMRPFDRAFEPAGIQFTGKLPCSGFSFLQHALFRAPTWPWSLQRLRSTCSRRTVVDVVTCRNSVQVLERCWSGSNKFYAGNWGCNTTKSRISSRRNTKPQLTRTKA